MKYNKSQKISMISSLLGSISNSANTLDEYGFREQADKADDLLGTLVTLLQELLDGKDNSKDDED